MPLLTCLMLALMTTPDSYGDSVIQFDPGIGGSVGYDDPSNALGPPTRFTVGGEVVSPFFPAWGTGDIVSIGAGGSITISFDEPVEDHPDNPYGIDLLVFGNTGCIDSSYPNGVHGGFFGADGGEIEVSTDGAAWFAIEGTDADGLWPTMAFIDSPAYGFIGGNQPTSFVRPIDPSLGPDDLIGADYDALVEHYDGSGGGVGIDLAPLGLESIRYVRVSVASDAFFSPEVDAVADVVPNRPGDVNLDGFIDIGDLLMVISNWNQSGTWSDANGSGLVEVGDLLVVLAGWGARPW
ncbi:MAG: dockerin type I domain-containing protein [Phycisphaerales bacterium]|nr:dockerin type I domain-containing protein [Phycisphaerales bacterium]